jgi:hypothetical protein
MRNTFRKYNVRHFSCRLLELIDEGLLDPTSVVEMCVTYMSEDEVKDMCWQNELTDLIWEEYEKEDAA